MTWWQAAILGVVEGLTEYLPVSSTGHLILVSWLMGLDGDAAVKEAVDKFNIVIQAGAIAAVLMLYRSRIRQMIMGLLGKDNDGRCLFLRLVVAFSPAAILGPLLDDTIESYLFHPSPVIGALFVGAFLMIAVSSRPVMARLRSPGLEIEQIDMKIAFLIGLAQCVAMWPGTSRSMMTIVAALLLGMRAKAAAEFSFLLGLITLGAATCYAGLKGGPGMLLELGDGSHSQGMLMLAIGFITATASAFLAVKWFVSFLTRYGLAPFGWYRLALSLLLAILILGGVIAGIGPTNT